jgi:hypothetical protein
MNAGRSSSNLILAEEGRARGVEEEGKRRKEGKGRRRRSEGKKGREEALKTGF